MTNIYYDAEHMYLEMDGHAGAGEKGHDLVCAGLSTLANTLACSLQYQPFHTEVEIDQEAGHLTATAKPGNEDWTLCFAIFETIATGLAMMADSYPEHVAFYEIEEIREEGAE